MRLLDRPGAALGRQHVTAVTELCRGAEDTAVIEIARSEGRILLTEDEDFGQLVFAAARAGAGVVLVRWAMGARTSLGPAAVAMAVQYGASLHVAFAVLEPGRVRLSRAP